LQDFHIYNSNLEQTILLEATFRKTSIDNLPELINVIKLSFLDYFYLKIHHIFSLQIKIQNL